MIYLPAGADACSCRSCHAVPASPADILTSPWHGETFGVRATCRRFPRARSAPRVAGVWRLDISGPGSARFQRARAP